MAIVKKAIRKLRLLVFDRPGYDYIKRGLKRAKPVRENIYHTNQASIKIDIVSPLSYYFFMDIFKWNAEKMNKEQKKVVLDEYENEILEAYENGTLKPSDSQTDYKKIAQNTIKKNRKINIRISDNDLSAIQRKAAREGIPYQTLVGSVLHKFASGFLKEVE